MKNHHKRGVVTKRLPIVLSVLMVVFGMLASTRLAAAQGLQQQINELRNKNQQTQRNLNSLEVEAAGFQEAISTLQAQIDSLVAEISANEVKRDELAKQIAKKEAELIYQQEVIGKSIVAQYIQDDMSMMEMMASSNTLSEYLDKQQYRSTVQNKIKATLDEIRAIQAQLAEQKALNEKLLAEQRTMEQQLGTQRAEQSRLLSMNQTQQSELDNQMKANNNRIAELRRKQAAENAKLFRGRVSNVPDTTGYPWASVQPFPNSYPDPWGMYKRQCVSYTAWKVHKDGKRMPYWGGRGNAKNWANNARAEGIPVHSSPQRGDIAVSTRGTYGHVMYVEEVYGNGTMRISQYNAGWDGRYSEAVVSTSGLEYVRFP